MPGSFRDLLARLPALELNRLQLYACLFRLCQERVSEIWGLVREPLWQSWARKQEAQIRESFGHTDWTARLFARLPASPDAKTLVWAATVVQVLDEIHRDRRGEVQGKEADLRHLPAELGGGLTLFLPPPACPIKDLIPENRQLQRGIEDLRPDLRSFLGLWWHLIPVDRFTVRPQLEELRPAVSRALARRLKEKRDLRIGLASPFADLDYLIRADPSRCHQDKGSPYHFVALEETSMPEAQRILEQIVEDCTRHEIDLLCFPELTLDTDLRRALSDLLATRNETNHPTLVMTGSFHLDCQHGGWANRSHLLNGYGEPLLMQEKCSDFSLPGEQVSRLPAEVRARLGLDERGGYEDIQLSSTFHLVDGGLGRLVIPICLDFCGETLPELFLETQANFFVVPAMTAQVKPFRDRAFQMGTLSRGTTLFVNSAWLSRKLGLQDPLAFVYLPALKAQDRATCISEHLSLFTIRELLGLP